MLLKNIAKNNKIFKPVIYGIAGASLNDEEKYFFSKNSCIGFILFSRNIENKEQLKNLTNSLKNLMGGEVLILIDQEGGRVARLNEPHWKKYPSGEYFASLYEISKEHALNAIYNNFQEIAKDLTEVGINVDCAPILDVLTESTHKIIGDRAYGKTPEQVIDLGKKVCESLLAQNVYPIIKHIPGHGRAESDSHLELPVVNASLKELQETDFLVFKSFAKQKFAMTAHVLYSAIDEKHCATNSKKIIEIIRKDIGFKNILMTDDLSMKALNGSFAEKTKMALNAGCDIILHCNGNMQEMQEINLSLPNLSDQIREKLSDD